MGFFVASICSVSEGPEHIREVTERPQLSETCIVPAQRFLDHRRREPVDEGEGQEDISLAEPGKLVPGLCPRALMVSLKMRPEGSAVLPQQAEPHRDPFVVNRGHFGVAEIEYGFEAISEHSCEFSGTTGTWSSVMSPWIKKRSSPAVDAMIAVPVDRRNVVNSERSEAGRNGFPSGAVTRANSSGTASSREVAHASHSLMLRFSSGTRLLSKLWSARR